MHDVVHQVINVLIVHLLIRVLKLVLRGLASRCRVLLFLSAAGFTPLVLRSLLAKAMLRRTAVPRLAPARASWLSLMVRKLVAVLENAAARSWLI